MTNNGFVEIYGSTIFNNYAYQTPIATILDSRLTSIIDDCVIHSNQDLFDTWVTETTGA